jgi:uncharacterized metal-binding protein
MSCACSSGKTVLIYACSGAANTGFLADQVVRGLVRDKAGSMTCLAAIGAGLSAYVESARGADRNIVIDGCPVGCGKKIFENVKIPFEQIVVTNFGVEKGKTAITPEVVAEVAGKIREVVCNDR